MNEKQKAVLEPLADATWGIFLQIEGLDDAGLATLHEAASAASETNCWWATFRAAQIVRPLVEAEQARRKSALQERQP